MEYAQGASAGSHAGHTSLSAGRPCCTHQEIKSNTPFLQIIPFFVFIAKTMAKAGGGGWGVGDSNTKIHSEICISDSQETAVLGPVGESGPPFRLSSKAVDRWFLLHFVPEMISFISDQK